MHRHPAGRLSATLRAALVRCGERLAPDAGHLLVIALLLVATGSVFALLPGSDSGSPATPALAVDAASQVRTTAATSGGGDAPHGDWQREHHPKRNAAAAAQPADQQPNPNCSLVVPANPLSETGLVTPYQLKATDRAKGPCHETAADQSAFVEAAIYDPAGPDPRHRVSIYHPLVIDDGSKPAVAPVPVMLPPNAVVGIWFGFNGDVLRLTGPGAGSCVNGLDNSPFGQFAYCHASEFFAAVNADAAFQAAIPDIGTIAAGTMAGKPCPTTRDFTVVDQDQSDNLATSYRVINGRTAQVTKATQDAGTPLTNGSDEGLLAKFIAPALGCTPFTAPDLTSDMAPTAALALNELSAAKFQRNPALVPTSDPMTQVNGRTSETKTNLYRAGVNQPPLPAGQTPQQYCAGIKAAAPAFLAANVRTLGAFKAPAPDQPNLLTFLKDRLTATLQNLGCTPARDDGKTTQADPSSVADNQAAGSGGNGEPSGTTTSQTAGANGGTNGGVSSPASVASPPVVRNDASTKGSPTATSTSTSTATSTSPSPSTATASASPSGGASG